MEYSDIQKKYLGGSTEEENNKKKKKSASYADIASKYGLSADIDQDYIDSFFSDVSNFSSDTSSSVASRYGAYSDLRGRADTINTWLLSNIDTLDRDTYTRIRDSLRDADIGLRSTYNNFKAKGEEGWKKYLEDAEEREKKAREDALWAGVGGGDSSLPLGTVPDIIHDVREDNENGFYVTPKDDWSEEQRYIFGTLYLESPSDAKAYARTVNNANAKAKEESEKKKVQDSATSNFWSGLGHTLAGIGGSVFGLADALDYLVKGNAGVDMTTSDGQLSPFEYYQTVTGGISEHLNDEYGVIDESVPIIGGKGWGDVYGLGTSIVQSAVSGRTLGSAGTLVSYFGQGMASGIDEAKNLGASDEQAVTYGLILGLGEGVAESIGIEKLFNIGSSTTFKEAMKNVLKQAGVEGLEEGLTSVIGNVADAWALKDKGKLQTMVAQYMSQGMTEEEAKMQVFLDSLEGIAYDALGGFVSGGVHAGRATGIQTGISNYNASKVYGNKSQMLVDDAMAVENNSQLRDLAQKYQEGRLSKGKNLTGGQINRLLETTDNAKLKNAILQRLGDLGETTDVTSIAEILTRYAKGEKLSSKDYARLGESDKGYLVMTEMMPENIKSGALSNKWAENIGTRRVKPEVYNKDYANAVEMVKQFHKKAEEDEKRAVNEAVSNANVAVSDNGKTVYKDEKGDSYDVNIKGIVSTDNGELKVELDNGKTVSTKSLSFSTHEEGLMYEMVARMETSPETANEIIKTLKPSNAGQAAQYYSTIPLAYKYGTINYEAGLKNINVSDKVKKLAFNRGKIDATINAKTNRGVANGKTTKKNGIVFEGDYVYDEKTANELQKASMPFIEVISQMSNLETHVFESKVIKGKRVAYIDGKWRPAPNGYFKDGNKIYIDINAGNAAEGAMLFTMAHEITHYIREWNAEGFKEFADFLISEYGKMGVSVTALIEAQKKKIEKSYKEDGKALPSDAKLFDMAYEELVADAMSEMLADPKAYEKLAKLKQKNRTLWEKVGEAIKAILDKFKSALGIYKTEKPSVAKEAYLVRGFSAEAYNKLQDLYIKAFVEADANYEASIGTRNLKDFADAKNENGEPLFQYRAMEADESAYREMLHKWGKMSGEQIDNLFATIDNAMELIKDNLEVLDYAWEADIDDRAFSPVKPNSDKLYQVSLDFSTLCRKRILQQTVQAQLQEALNKPLSREEGIAIRDALIALQEEGRQIEVACALCYVESARMKSPEQIKKFMNNRENVIKEFFAGKSGGNIKEKIKQAEADAKEQLHRENPNGIKGKDGKTMLDPRTASLKEMPKKYADVIRDAKRKAKASYKPTAKEQNLIEVAKGMSVSDFTSPEGLENLAKNYPDLFDAYTSYVRNATKSKGIESDTWWRAGDSSKIGDVLIANMNRENGLRSQSWSDFQVIHILDYIASTIELATRNTKEQAYSKVPDYVELMGLTGVMINMSLIPTATFNGTLEYDSVEGIDYKRALELRNKYPKTAGTICIGVDNVQIKLLLADTTIDYVIPYHKSGMSKAIRKLMHIPTWSQYEEYQSEKNLSRADAEKQAKKYGVKLLDASDPNYHKGTSFSEWFNIKEAQQIAKKENAHPSDKAKQKQYGVMYGGYMAMQNAANNYLKLCAERGLSPKFSHEKADFTTEANYWKLLIDRKMVNNITGEVIEQETIKPIFSETEVMRILNDELARYPKVKEDQDYATRKVTEKFLSGEIKGGMSAEAIAKVMKKPVDNVAKVNILASASEIKAFDSSEDRIAQNIKDIAKMSSVYDVDKSKLEKTGKKPFEIFEEHFANWGNHLYSDELGDISVERSSIKSEIRHGLTAEKIASIEAIPAVVKEGEIIFVGQKSESGLQRIVVCAPIKIGDTPYYMGVMLQRDVKTQRLYLHNVAIEKEASDITQDDLLTTGSRENNEYLFVTSILQKALAVKYQNADIRYSERDSNEVANDFLAYIDNILQGRGSWYTSDVYQYIAEHDELNFIERIFAKDKTVKSELEAFLKGIDNTRTLDRLSWFIGRTYSQKAPRWGSNGNILYPYQGAVRTFRNAIKRRTNEIMTAKVNGTNLGLKNGESSLEEVKSFFDRLNSNEEIGRFAEKVFATAERLGVNIRFVNQTFRSGVAGDAVGDMVEYKTSYFNDTAVSDQRKASVILHELLHTCTVYVLNENKTSGDVYYRNKTQNYEMISNAATRLNRIFNEIKNDPDFKGEYGITDAMEMVAELSNERFVAKLKKKNLWESIVDWICELFGFKRGTSAYDNAMMCVDYILDNPEIDEYKAFAKGQRRAAHREGMDVFGRTIDADGQVYYSERDSDYLTEYSVQTALYDSLDHADKGDDNLIRISSMPRYIVDLLGIDGDFYIYRNHAYENMVSEEQALEEDRFDRKANYHNLGIETMTEAVLSLEHPIMTIATKSKNGNPTVIMLLPVFGKNNTPLYSVLSFYSNKPINGDLSRKPHIVLTIHERNYFEDGGRAGISDVVKSAIADGRVLDFDKKRREDLSVIAKSAGLGNITEASLKESLAHFRKYVNTFREENKIIYSERDTDAISDRTLLANALESVAKSDIEKTKLAQYKQKIALIESEQKKLAEIKAKANELRFTKGRTPSDTKAMRDLEFEANQIANRINTYDKQLLNLESTTALKNVLEREKAQLRKRLEQKGKQAVREQRQKDAKTIRELMTRHTESRKNAIEGRNKTEMRHKIKNVVSDLNKLLLNPTKDQHVPIGLQKVVAEALDAINMDTMNAEERVAYYNDLISKASNPDEIAMLKQKRDFFEYRDMNFKDRITALKNAYAEFKESDDPLIRNAHNVAIEELIKNTSDEVGNKSLKDMSLAQLEAVYDMYKAILATVRNSNKMFKEGRQATVVDNSEAVKTEVREVGGHNDRVKKSTKGIKAFAWNLMKPIYALQRIGSKTLTKLFDNVRAGEDSYAVDINEAREFFRDKSETYNYNSWDFKKRYAFKDSTGNSFALSLEQIMSLYAYSKREQADRHLEFGGFVFDDSIEVTEKNKLGIPIKYEVNDATPYRLRVEDLAVVIDTLTAEQKAFIDEMQTYLSEVMGAKGNEVTLALYDIKMFKEKHYFPLKTSRYFREFNPEQSANPMLRNSGFTKKTVPQAGNPIVLSNFMEVWTSHVNDMSMYHSFVLPLEDFMRVYNYSSTVGGYDSVQQYIKNAYGAEANQYIERLMQDINGGVVSNNLPNGWLKMFGKFKKATVAASLSTIVQQPTAIIRAMALINPRHFFGISLKDGHKKTWEEIKKYAPIAIIKEMGGIDVGSGRQARDFITEQSYKGFGKIKGFFTDSAYRDNIFMWGATKADELGWNSIWKAVKREVASTQKLKPGTEEFFNACGKRFTEVVTQTQVYDSVFARNGLMRDKGDLNKFATSFMGEPTTSFNMMYNAILSAKRGGSKAQAVRTIASVYASIVAASAMASLVYALRDDDEDESYLEKWAEAFGNKLSSEIWIHNMIPYVRDIASILEGWDVERPDMSIIADIKASFDKLFKINDEGEFEWKVDFSDFDSVYSAIENFGGSIASAFGIPLKNLMRDTKAIFNGFETMTNDIQTEDFGEAFIEGFTGKESDKSDKLYNAIINGDNARLEIYKKGYKTEDSYEQAVRKALRENDSRIHEAAQARYDGNISEYSRIVRGIVAEGHFSQDTVVGAVNAELSAIKKGESTTDGESAKDKNEATSIYSASDLNNAFDNGDTYTAKQIIDDLVRTKVANGMTEKEAKSSLRSSMTSYWKPLYKKAYQSGNSSEMARIRQILYSSGLYGTANDVIKSTQNWLKD